MPELGAGRRGPGEQALGGGGGRVLLAGVEVDQLAVEPEADRPPEVLLDHRGRPRRERHALVEVARGLGDAGDDQPGQRRADSSPSVCASQIRTSTVPKL